MPHRKYRALERDCRLQAAITGHRETRDELEKMEREYKALADWLEARQQADQQPPSRVIPGGLNRSHALVDQKAASELTHTIGGRTPVCGRGELLDLKP